MCSAFCQYHVSFPGLGIHDLEVNRIAFAFDLFGRHFTIYWYGLLFAFALLLCMVLAVRQAKRHHLKEDDILDYLLLMIPFMVVGARLYYVAFEWDAYKDDPARIFNISEGGLGFYGGVIGGLIALLIMAAVKHIKVHHLVDYIIVYVPLGQAIGRWGNFFNQEAFGTNTDLPWGMISEGTRAYLTSINPDPLHPLPGIDPNLPVHPTFFYEFLANMVTFVILIFMRRKADVKPYRTLLTYLLLYGLTRYFVEGIRTDPLVFTLNGNVYRISQVISLAMVIIAVVFFIVLEVLDKKRAQVRASLPNAEDAGVLILGGEPADAEETDDAVKKGEAVDDGDGGDEEGAGSDESDDEKDGAEEADGDDRR